MLKWIFCLCAFLQVFADLIPGYNSGPAKDNLLRSDNVGNSIFLWQEPLESGSCEIRYVTSFGNGRFSNYAVFGEVEEIHAYNTTYDNALNCLAFYSEENKLYYSYGDPRTSTFAQNKQVYTVSSCNVIYFSQMRYCTVTNAFYIVLGTDTGLFFLKYNGAFSSVQLVNNENIENASFNFDAEGNILVAYTKNVSSETLGCEYYVVYYAKNGSLQNPLQLNTEDRGLEYFGVFQVNQSGDNYWAVVNDSFVFFVNQAGNTASDQYFLANSNNVYACRSIGELIGFHSQVADPDEGIPASVTINYYNMTGLLDSSASIDPIATSVIENVKLTADLYSQISQKPGGIFLTTTSSDQMVLKNYFLPNTSNEPNLISTYLSPFSVFLNFIAGFQYPFVGARLAWFSFDSLLGFYNYEKLFSTEEAFRKFIPTKFQRGI